MKRHDNSDIKRENRRAIRIFIPILLASAVSAAVQGSHRLAPRQSGDDRILSVLDQPDSPGLRTLHHSGSDRTPDGCAYLLYGRAKHRFNQWNGEDETVIDQAENDLSKGMLLAQINQICIFFFFAVAYYISDPILFFIPLISFVLAAFLILLFQKQSVDFLKTTTRKARARSSDFNFQKKWD